MTLDKLCNSTIVSLLIGAKWDNGTDFDQVGCIALLAPQSCPEHISLSPLQKVGCTSKQRDLAGDVLFVTCSLGFKEGHRCKEKSLGSKRHLGPAERLDGAECKGKQGSIQARRH